MQEVSPDQLKQAVEGLHDCSAILRGIETVHESYEGETVWEGVVHVFEIRGHPKAKVCFARCSPVEGSEKRKFYAVLAIPPVLSSTDAIRAAILSENPPSKQISGGNKP